MEHVICVKWTPTRVVGCHKKKVQCKSLCVQTFHDTPNDKPPPPIAFKVALPNYAPMISPFTTLHVYGQFAITSAYFFFGSSLCVHTFDPACICLQEYSEPSEAVIFLVISDNERRPNFRANQVSTSCWCKTLLLRLAVNNIECMDVEWECGYLTALRQGCRHPSPG